MKSAKTYILGLSIILLMTAAAPPYPLKLPMSAGT